MFEVFKGSDPGFTRQFQAIQNIVRLEYNMELTSPEHYAHYIYWQDDSCVAQGCALINFDKASEVYTLNCIAFYMDDQVLEALGDENDLYDQLIRQFYMQTYQQFCNMFAGHDSLMVRLPTMPIEDSLMLGHWPYIKLTSHPRGKFHMGQLDISAHGERMFRESNYHPTDRQWIH